MNTHLFWLIVSIVGIIVISIESYRGANNGIDLFFGALFVLYILTRIFYRKRKEK